MKYTFDYDGLKLIQGGTAFTFFLLSLSSLEFWFFYIFYPIDGEQYYVFDILQLGCLLISLIIFWFYLKKDGLYILNNTLYTCQFILSKPIQLKKINTNGATDIALVTYKNRHPEYSYELRVKLATYGTSISYKVFILNEYHSKRKLIYETDDKFKANEVMEFVEKGLKLKRTEFKSPNFSRKKYK